jgi:hypothetical protein
MKYIFQIIAALSMMILVSSCDQKLDFDIDKYEAIKPEIKVNETALSLSGEAQSVRIQITCNSYWHAQSTSSWLYLNQKSGIGDGNLSIEVYNNPSTISQRSGSITVTDCIHDVTITISQSPSVEKGKNNSPNNSQNEGDNPTPTY